jgi:hypothetical protein
MKGDLLKKKTIGERLIQGGKYSDQPAFRRIERFHLPVQEIQVYRLKDHPF